MPTNWPNLSQPRSLCSLDAARQSRAAPVSSTAICHQTHAMQLPRLISALLLAASMSSTARADTSLSGVWEGRIEPDTSLFLLMSDEDGVACGIYFEMAGGRLPLDSERTFRVASNKMPAVLPLVIRKPQFFDAESFYTSAVSLVEVGGDSLGVKVAVTDHGESNVNFHRAAPKVPELKIMQNMMRYPVEAFWLTCPPKQ